MLELLYQIWYRILSNGEMAGRPDPVRLHYTEDGRPDRCKPRLQKRFRRARPIDPSRPGCRRDPSPDVRCIRPWGGL